MLQVARKEGILMGLSLVALSDISLEGTGDRQALQNSEIDFSTAAKSGMGRI